MKKMADGGMVDQQPQESPIMTMLRNYVLGHGGLGGHDVVETQTAMNVDPSSDTVKGYAHGGMVDEEDDASMPHLADGDVLDDFSVNTGDSDTVKGLPVNLPATVPPVPPAPASQAVAPRLCLPRRRKRRIHDHYPVCRQTSRRMSSKIICRTRRDNFKNTAPIVNSKPSKRS